MPETLTETEKLALAFAQQQITIATLQHRLALTQIRAAHGLADADQIAPDGSIVRAPKPEPEPQPAPDEAPEVETKET